MTKTCRWTWNFIHAQKKASQYRSECCKDKRVQTWENGKVVQLIHRKQINCSELQDRLKNLIKRLLVENTWRTIVASFCFILQYSLRWNWMSKVFGPPWFCTQMRLPMFFTQNAIHRSRCVACLGTRSFFVAIAYFVAILYFGPYVRWAFALKFSSLL